MEDVTFKFEELTVYKKAIEFINDAYNVSKTFPKSEIYGLTSQFLRASNSIALNITEGSGDTNLQFSRFLKIALGSVKECVVCLTIAKNQRLYQPKSNFNSTKYHFRKCWRSAICIYYYWFEW